MSLKYLVKMKEQMSKLLILTTIVVSYSFDNRLCYCVGIILI